MTERERKLARLTKESIAARQTERKAPLERNRSGPTPPNEPSQSSLKRFKPMPKTWSRQPASQIHLVPAKTAQGFAEAARVPSGPLIGGPLPKDRLDGKQEAVKGNWRGRPAAIRLLNDHFKGQALHC